MKITDLRIYPIKSLSGISLKESKVTPRGLAHDRRWMLVDNNHRFISQREHIEMALIQCNIIEDNLVVSHKQDQIEPLSIKVAPNSDSEHVEVEVWGDKMSALKLAKEYGDWFSAILKQECHLVYMPEASELSDWSTRFTKTGEAVSFADGYPILVVGEASVADFNIRLDRPVSVHNFRPNIVVSTNTPYEEESWRDFQLGSTNFKGVRACGRCQMIGYDQDKATNDPAVLRTLASYRSENNKVLFGLCASLDVSKAETAIIKVGEDLIG